VIGVVTTSYPRSPEDGAGVFVRERVRALRQQGHNVEIVAAGDSVEDADHGVTRIAAHGLFYQGGAPEALEDDESWGRVSAWSRALGFSLALFAEVARRRGRWTAVESHWIVPCGLVTAIALPGIPHRSHVHGGDLFLLRRLPLAGSLARAICRGRPELVFASAHLKREFETLLGGSPESFGAGCRVEAAPFDRSLFHARPKGERARLRQQLNLVRLAVLAAGRLVPIKGFDVLIAALARMAEPERPELLIAGDGPERGALMAQAKAAGVAARFLGTVGQGTLAEIMAAADLFVLPSRSLADGRSEGMPLAVREAMACGLRVIASATGGLTELDRNVGLHWVSPDDPGSLARAIASVLARSQS
jgi:glycosyltransferase involved in cell wall biosynthesis